MTTTRRTGAALFASSLALVLLGGCGDDGGEATAVANDCEPVYTFPTLEEGKLTVAAPQYPPAFSQQGSAEPTGIDADFLSDFAADACLDPQWEVIPQAGAIESVKGGRADIAAGNWYATPERAEIVSQTDPLFVDRPTIAAKTEISDIQELKGKKVGTITGYLWVEEMQELFGNDLKLYSSPDAAFADLEAGRIDAALFGSVEIAYILSQNSDSDIVAAPMVPDPAIASSVDPYLPNYPHTMGNDALTEALNDAIGEARETGRIAEILEKNGVDPLLADVSDYVD